MGLKIRIGVLFVLLLSLTGYAQEDTHIVDSLRSVLPSQEGRETVLTMIELTWEFYDISYDDCLNWGERAIKEAQNLGLKDLEAKANYVLGIQYAYHGDLDLAKEYLYVSYHQYIALDDTENAFESLWDIATYELTLGNIDTSYQVYEKALSIAEDDFYYAKACIYSNMALIEANKKQFEKAYDLYEKAKRLFEYVDDERMAIRMDYDMANVCYERGQSEKARKMYWKVLPQLERFEDYYPLCGACNKLGIIYENDFVDYDSSMYYLQKAISYSEMPIKNKETEVLINSTIVEVMVEIGNVLAHQGDYQKALSQYHDALLKAEDLSYKSGQMQACVGLIRAYSHIGNAEKSLQYYQQYTELEKASGITHMRSALSKPLIVAYARLERFEEMSDELDALDELRLAQLRENADLYEQNDLLQDEVADLVQQHETQSVQIQSLQSQRNHYRLAFFGLLAIMLFTAILFVAYKIVRKNRPKIEKG